MKHIPRIPALPQPKSLFSALGQMLLTFFLCASQLSAAHAPFALAMVAAAGARMPGLFSLLGTVAGCWLFLDFQPGLRTLAAAILIFSVNTAFYDARLYARPLFRPLSAALVTALVQSVYLLERSLSYSLVFLLTLCIQSVSCVIFLWISEHQKAEQKQYGILLLLGALSLSLVNVRSAVGFSLGRTLFHIPLLLACGTAAPCQGAFLGFCAGLTVDLVPQQPLALFCVVLTCSCAMASLLRVRRGLLVLGYCLGAAVIPSLLGADYPLSCLWEALCASAVFLLLPRRLLPAAQKPAKPPEPLLPEAPWKAQLEQSAAAFRDLYDSFFRGTASAPPENPSVIFDRAAEQVCRGCVLCSSCWQQNYNTTYNAFNDACPAMLRRGQALAQDFPLHFTSRCVHLQPFLAAVNTELRTYLLRQQYHRRLMETRRQAQAQYAQLGDLLSSTAGAVEAMAPAEPLGYRIGSALRPRQGNHVCGDQLAVFEVGSTLYLLLSDGMGNGESAHREAAMTVRLLQQFLKAGIDPSPALKTLNAALALRGEDGGGFTTIDLLALQRSNGSATLYKYGAAPSYLKRSGSVSRFTAASLPAGLQNDAQAPEHTRLSLPGGSFFVMVSDGIADETDDEWLQNLLAGWNGNDASALTTLILSESRSRKGCSDDCAVLVLYLPPPEHGSKTAL